MTEKQQTLFKMSGSKNNINTDTHALPISAVKKHQNKLNYLATIPRTVCDRF